MRKAWPKWNFDGATPLVVFEKFKSSHLLLQNGGSTMYGSSDGKGSSYGLGLLVNVSKRMP